MLTLLADVSDAVPSSSDPITLLLGSGLCGVFIVLFLFGYIIPKSTVDDIRADAKRWQTAFETEREAHQTTRESLAQASSRADVAVIQVKTLTDALVDLGHRGAASP